MKIGSETAIAFFVMMDLFYPEKIRIGNNTIIGYNTTILTHEYLIDEYRIGEVQIGDNVMIGANTTILPGVVIGDGAVVGAGTVVSKDVAPHTFVIGNPMRSIK
jgi:acetyltransferase-like isoleucine patch superfamily enzyme